MFILISTFIAVFFGPVKALMVLIGAVLGVLLFASLIVIMLAAGVSALMRAWTDKSGITA